MRNLTSKKTLTQSCCHPDHVLQASITMSNKFLLWAVQSEMFHSVHMCSVVSNSFRPHDLQPRKLLCPWNFTDKNTGVGGHYLIQGIFLNQGSNLSPLHLLHWYVDSLPLNHLGSLVTFCDNSPNRLRQIIAQVIKEICMSRYWYK